MIEFTVPPFEKFASIPRLSRDMVVTEKIDGTNAVIHIGDNGTDMIVGSRTRWIAVGDDNFGFAAWAHDHKDELLQLGPGTHYGEWWGRGIQRGYGIEEKRFSLFNTKRWTLDNTPSCVSVVPVLYQGPFSVETVDEILLDLHTNGSRAAPGFMKPEGVVVFHTHANALFKKTLDHNDQHKFMNEVDPRK